MAAIQSDRIKRLTATNPRIVPVPIPANTPISGTAPGTTIGSLATQAANAQAAADAANLALGNIASDNVLSAGEKSAVILDYNTIIGEQSGIDSQAITFGQSRTAYDAAMSALMTYLVSLAPAWNDTAHDTPIIGTTFRAKFADVYAARQALLNAISGQAKALADSAQSTANTALSTANYAANRAVGDMTAQVLSNSGTTIQCYASTLLQFINGPFSLSIGAGGLTSSYNGVSKLAMSSYGSASFGGDLITSGQVLATGTTYDPSTGNSASIVGIGRGAYGVLGIVGNTTAPAGVCGQGNGGKPGGQFNNGSGGIALVAGKTEVTSLKVTGGVWSPFEVSGDGYFSGTLVTGGNLNVNGVLSASSAYITGNMTVSSLNGFTSPSNILAFNGIGYPSNPTTPAGFMAVRTLSGGIVNIPYFS